MCFISYWKLSWLTDLYYFFSYKSFLSNWNSVRDYINCTSSCCCFFSPTVNLSDKCMKSVPCQRYVTSYSLTLKIPLYFHVLIFLSMDLHQRLHYFTLNISLHTKPFNTPASPLKYSQDDVFFVIDCTFSNWDL